jgi:hypothetical protein
MAKGVFWRVILTSAVLGVTGAAHSEVQGEDPEAVRDRIRVLETSVNRSSVTGLYTAQQRGAKLDLLAQAEARVEAGDLEGALTLIRQAGRLLYPMEGGGAESREGRERAEWLAQVDAVMDSVLPAAYAIASEKGADADELDRVARQRAEGRASLQAGDLDRGERLITDAYDRLQAAVAALRSGDRLRVGLPTDDSRLAWQEAERRYLDWRYTADWMQLSADAIGADPQAIATGSRLADEIYSRATRHAQREDWSQAVTAIEGAYLVMEDHWRLAGIDI